MGRLGFLSFTLFFFFFFLSLSLAEEGRAVENRVMELGGGNLRVDNGGGFVFESQGNLVRCANLEIHGEVKLRREERQLGGHRDGIEAVIVEGDDDRSVELAWIDDRTMAIRSIGGKIRIRRQGREVAVADMTFQLKGDAEELRTSCCDGQVPVNAEDRYGVYVNRWQSWSFCGTVLDGERLPPPATPRISNKGFHDGGVPGNRFTSSRFKRRTKISDMFLLCGRPKHPMLFAGFLSQVKKTNKCPLLPLFSPPASQTYNSSFPRRRGTTKTLPSSNSQQPSTETASSMLKSCCYLRVVLHLSTRPTIRRIISVP